MNPICESCNTEMQNIMEQRLDMATCRIVFWCEKCGRLRVHSGLKLEKNIVPVLHRCPSTLFETKSTDTPLFCVDGKFTWLCPGCKKWIPMGKDHEC